MDLTAAAWFLGGLVFSLGLGLATNELYDWGPHLARRLVNRAARRLPAEVADRYREEWAAYIEEMPGKLGKLLAAIGIWVGAGRIASASKVPVPASSSAAASGKFRNIAAIYAQTMVKMILEIEALNWRRRFLAAASLVTVVATIVTFVFLVVQLWS